MLMGLTRLFGALNFFIWGARVTQWWEHSPLTNVVRVLIPAWTPYVGWVCCWFSPFLREVFLQVLWFSPLLKPTISNSNSTRNQVDEEPLCGCATSKLLFIYLFIYFTLESSYVARFRPQKVFPFVNIMRICSFRCDYSTQSCNSRNLLLQQCKTRDT